MNTFKKIFAAAAAVASAGVLAMASITASATEIPPVENAPYTVYMSIQAGGDASWAPEAGVSVSVPQDGTYTLEYTFVNGSASVEALIIDTDINAYSFAPEETADPIAEGSVKMTIDNIELKRTEGTVDAIAYNGPSNGAFRTGDNGTCIRYNILNEWTNPSVSDIDKALPGTGANAGDIISVTFTISGLGEANEGGDTTTTGEEGEGSETTTTTTKSGSSSNSGSSSKTSSGTTTSTVTQTADAGVVAIVVGATAAAALAAGAMTIKRKRK